MTRMDWEKARRRDQTEKAPRKPRKWPSRGTPKQRQLIKALTKELGLTGREKNELWREIRDPQDASQAIDDLIQQKRRLRERDEYGSETAMRNHLAEI